MNKRTFKQRIAYVLALVMMLSVCNNVWATELQNQMAYNESVTNGQTTTSSAIQEGEDTNLTTEQGIHIIKTEEELKAVGEHLDWEYQLANDIDLEGEEWIPIGSEDTPFTGAFDGNGYEISNFQINQEDEANIGFFGVAEDVELINIKLSKYEIVGADYTGALVGKLTGEDNLIKKCQFIKGKISGETNVGGITGYMENTTLSQSYVTGSVTGGYYIGGIVGMSKYNKITNVFNLSDVSGNNYVGGIIGKSTATTTLENSYAAGAVSGQSSTIGGLYGQDKKITVTNCYYDQIASTLTANTDESRLTAELRREATYENWDFNTIWDIDEDVTYPYLYELEKPDGIEKEVTIQGSGTEADPYIIRTTEQLLQINNNLGAHYKLGDDIDLGGMTWTPLGTTSMPFTGTFDGDEHTISNFVINDSLLDYVGLFGVTNNATIKNVTLDQASVAGRYYVGGLIGLAQGANKSIVNCHILSGEIIGNNNVGGLIGASDDINSATYFVKDCSTNVSVNGRYNNIGGLIGWYRGSISGCYTMGNVKGGSYEEVSTSVGGLIGNYVGQGSYYNGSWGETHYYSVATISNCYTTGEVTGVTDVGGLVGHQYYGIVTQCAATGSIEGASNVGGLVGKADIAARYGHEYGGYNHAVVWTNNYVLASVKGTNNVGGLLGYTINSMTMTNCYAAGNTTGESNVGGLYGEVSGLTVTSSYYDSVVTPVVSQYNTNIAKLTAAMKIASTFNGWNFESIWDIKEGETYPYLRNLPRFEGLTGGEVKLEGTGTAEDPYIVRTTQQLIDVKFDLNSCYKLGNDLDLAGMTWTPLGTTSMPFTGTFDGDGYTISNFVINDSLLDYVGLFGVTNNATIKNVTLAQVNLGGRYYVGGLIGLAQGANKSIVNCHILSGEIIGNNNVGGLIGASDDINSATYFVKDCSTNVSVNGRYNNIGGLIGWYRGSISGCYTMGNVKGGSYEEVSTSVGGLIGNYVGQGSYYNGSWGETHYYSAATLSNCYTTGKVIGVTDVGGLVGHQYYGIVTQCAATGSVEGASNVGGLVGKADIAARYGHEYGGYNHEVVWTNNYALANVKGSNNVGGLLGYTINSMKMTNCYAAGNTTGDSNVGGLYGDASGLTVTSSYYDSVVTPVVSQYNTIIAKLTPAMKVAATFSGWNFESVWDIKEGATYPYLRNLPRFEGLTGGEVKLEGTGTATDPYIIRTTQQLIDIKLDLSSYYKLGNNIDLGGMTWAPIGTNDIPFTGTFDGDGFTISNFVINDSLLDYVGLFGVTNNATIKNVTLAQVNLGGRYYVGGLIGLAKGANKSIVNCHILSGEIIGNNNVGGLIGASDDINSATYFVKDCSTNVSVNGRYNNIGGLIGWYRGSISGCYTMGNVKCGSYEEVSTSVGGLIGNYVGQGSYYNGSWGETHYYSVATLSNCYTTGEVTGVTDVGGLVGHQYYGIVTQCATTGYVEGASNVGGLVGKADIAARYGHEYGGYNHEVVWTNNYALANVKGSNNVGGLLGYTINSMIMKNCYAVGNTTGASNVGGLYGNATGLTVTSSYYDSVVTPVVSQYNTNIAKFTAAMKIAATFNGWNFESIWDIKEGATYPYLRNLPRFEGLTGGEVKLEGTGTAEDPYIVRTTQQLIDVKFDLNSCYKLGNDIDLDGITWEPLGTADMPFTGTFDGNEYTISNFIINDSLLDYVGLFGVTNNATIKNVTLDQVSVNGRYYVGGLIGLVQGTSKSIINCHILGGEVRGNNNVGGLIGASDDINSATYFVKDCSTNVSVNGRYNNIGGLIGWYRGSISGCYTMGNVKGGSYEEVSTSVGGLIGNYVGQGSYYNGSWGETHYYSVATISNCYTTGKVTGVTDVGGLVGHQYYGIVAQCAATGSVEGASNVGGLVGKADIAARYGHEYGGYNHEVVWTNNYTLANVKGTNNVGGLLGYTINSMTMTNCYAAGSTAGESNVGGLYGNATGLTVTSSYYDSVVTPVVSQYNTNIAKLTAAMKIASTFNGWNFESIWDIKESETYPYLRNLPRFEGLTGGEVKLEGTGTAEDPYIVRTTQQLIDVKFDLNSCYKLGNDIDLDGMTWEPLGSVDMPFTGTFDGNGFTISNFIINAEATDNLGLFSVISNASIKNLTLDNIKIVGRRNIGALAGLVNGTSTNITNCQVINSSIKGTYDVGGFIGKTNSGATAYITECFADANVTGDYNEVGGLAGYFKGNITKSHAKGIISGGHYMETNEYVGGFVGNMAGGTVEYCYSLAEVSGLNYIGGFFGGAASTTIRNSFSFATVTGNQYVGGMIGICNGATTIAYSYVAGKVVGEAYVSGLCGVGTNLTLVSSYYDSDINPYEPVVLSSSARFTASMKRPTNYSDWNFEDIWNIDPGKSYPYLRIMVKPDEANNNGSESALTGEGTEENPYVITNREELEAIQYELDAHYVLGNDIDLENVNWQPIGSTECPFTGTLDGANFTISNLKIESEANTNVGLFSVTNNATIKNLNIVGVSIIGSTNVGAIVGLMQGPSKQLVNCHVSKGQIKGDTFVGGLVGTTDTTSAITGNYIVKCSSDVTVTATVKIAGSIVGGLRGTMTGSFATGEVIGGSYVGGLIGYYYGGTVSQCYFTGKVTGVDYVGGLIGYSEAGLTLSVCYATGIIKGNNYVGGLVGHMRGGKLVNCYALTVIEGAAYVGGLVGSASGSTAIVTCYFGGAITATSNFGGLSGIASYIAVTNSYFVESNSVISGGKTVAQMRQIATYAGWDFSSVWNMTEDQTYPYLKVLPIPDGITGELVTETPDGSGTAADPYVIKTVEQLLAVKNDLDAHYRLANDLDLEGIEWNCIGTMDEPFTGVFDGDGHTISNFSIEKVSTNYVGFFGVISNATIKNLTITGAHITGKNYVGTVVGLSLGKTSTIINVHVASGSVKGVLGVGGLVGAAGTVSINGYINIEGCSSDVEVSATGKYVGGLIGYLEGTIKGSYAIGTVQGDLYVGGLVGYSCGCTIENCYSLSVIVGNNYVGGIVGYCAGSTTIITTYFAGQITCKGTIYGGICAAVDNVVITNSYFNAWVAGIEVTGDYGKLSGSLVHAATYVDWDFTTVWGIEEGVGYPYLKDNQHVQVPSAGLGTEENPYLVSTKEQLLAIKYEVNAYYKLVNDIDLGGIEWTPIGDKNTPFGGHFDGQNHTISNFVMTDGNKNYVGFFGAIHNATIINLILADIKVEGNHYVGGLVGTAFGESNHIENCHIQGSKVNGVAWVGGLIGATQVDASITIIGCSVDAVIVGQGNYVGGIIGYMKGSITTSYVTGSVTGGDYVGGLVGYGTYVVIKTSYSLAVVTGQSYVGGIIAGAAEATTITHCYVAGKVIARTTIVGGICGVVTNITIVGCYYDAVLVGIESKFEGEVSKLTGGLRIKATFVGWDFDTVWTIQEGSTYPYLKDLPKPAGVNKPSGGDTIKGTGTKEDPYLISSKADLLYIRYELDAYFKLTCDIDLEGAEWTPIGSLDKPFKGHFDGNGFTISNFVVSQGSSDYVGFFGAVHNAVIINLTLSGMTIEGHHYVGGLVGIVLGNGTYIEGCHIISGHVTGTAWVGGLIGATQVGASVTVVGCAVNVVVIATGNYVGGIAGYIQGTVIRCYTSGSVTGGIYVGGFIGCSAGVTIKTSYSLTTVTGTNYVAGFIGQCIVATTIIDCYVAGKITCAGAVVGIFCGETIYIKASGCYYDGVACGIVVTEGIGTGKLTGSLTNMTTYVGWDFEIVWEIEIGIGYPHLIGLPKPEHGKPVFDESVPKGEGTEEDPYQITNKKQLINVKYELDACYEVMNDIDLEDEEWIPLGVSAEEAFTGTFNGNGYTISNLFIGNLELSSAGLFGVINNAVIKGINLVNANVASSDYVGSLVGKVIGEENYINECEVTEGIIEGERYIGGLVGGVDEENSASYCYFVDCTTNNEVNSSVSYAGGIIGYGKGDITRCIAEDNHVVGNNYVGGIVGYIYGNSTILECEGYSIVEGSSYVGGIAGRSKQISIEGCTTAANVNASRYVGGVVGYAQATTLSTCESIAEVNGTRYVGGLVGYLIGGSLENCQSDAQVTGDSNYGVEVGKKI